MPLVNHARHIGTGSLVINEKARQLIGDILESSRVSYGKNSIAFEKQFAALHSVPYAILSNSGTDALRIALHTLKSIHGWHDGDEVIVPATTFVATANIVLQNRMTPIFVDVLPDTFNIDPIAADMARSVITRAVIPVHLLGQPANVPAIRELASDLFVIEDSCETMFAAWDGVSVGSLGDIGCFSLYVAHILTAGVGGVGITSNPDYAAKMRSLVNHGLTVENLNLGENFAPRPMTGRRFQFDDVGYSSRLTEFEAALALSQLDDPKWNIINPRTRNAEHLRAALVMVNVKWARGGKTWLYSQETDRRASHSWMMFPIVIGPDAPAWLTKTALTAYFNEHHIETRDIPSLLGQPIYKFLNPDDFPESKNLLENGFYVGCHQGLTPDDVQYICDRLYDFCDLHTGEN